MLAVGVSQSGRTAEVVETLAWARDSGARTVAVTNGAGSALTEVADVSLVTLAGDELAVPATKTFTTQLLALAVLGLALRGDDRALDGLDRVAPAVHEALGTAQAAQELAAELAPVRRLVVSARGHASAVARELALKLQETCGVTAPRPVGRRPPARPDRRRRRRDAGAARRRQRRTGAAGRAGARPAGARRGRGGVRDHR